MDENKISFGDRVRVRQSPEAEALGLAGTVGQVYGETTPSVTGVEVIGHPLHDFALNVHFEDRNEAFWFAPNLLEFINHAPGTTMQIGISPVYVRTSSGEWVEKSHIRPWWKFWT